MPEKFTTRMRLALLLPLLAALAACAADTGRASPASVSKEELRQHCTSLMYADRASRGRSSPNWSVYEYCMKRPSEG